MRASRSSSFNFGMVMFDVPMWRTSPRSTSLSICRHVFMKFSWMYGRASGLRDSTLHPGGWKFGNGQCTRYISRYSSCRSASD